MKRTLCIAAVTLGALIPAAHAQRWHGLGWALAWLAPFVALAWRRPFARLACQATLVAGTLVTFDTAVFFVAQRKAMGLGYTRLALIMGAAALLPLLGTLALGHPMFQRPQDRQATPPGTPQPPDTVGPGLDPSPRRGPLQGWPGFLAWALCLGGFALVLTKAPPGMLLADRFLPGMGWLEASVLALYAGYLAEALQDQKGRSAVRRRAWGLFSLVFFAQLALGLTGLQTFLLNASAHLPVPALILAGPLYRAEGFFMPILFCAAALLAGPSWCSHLCYIGAWDSALASGRPVAPLPGWVRPARMGLAALVAAVALGMGVLGAPALLAGAAAAAFGLVGVGVMLLVSRRYGVMAHCVGFCPMGLFAGLLGRLSPWRLRVGQGCTGCGACAKACRYDALRPSDLSTGRAGISCSLCADCLGRCGQNQLSLTFLGRSSPRVTSAFNALLAALCALFLGVARM